MCKATLQCNPLAAFRLNIPQLKREIQSLGERNAGKLAYRFISSRAMQSAWSSRLYMRSNRVFCRGIRSI
jgi:hypothetical protein